MEPKKSEKDNQSIEEKDPTKKEVIPPWQNARFANQSFKNQRPSFSNFTAAPRKGLGSRGK